MVNVASIEAYRAAPTFAVYAACKAGLVSFTKTLAVEVAEHQVRVNCITPDMTITPGNHGQRSGPVDPDTFDRRSPEQQAAIERYIPLGREGVVEECGAVVAFLCSPLASYVTGTTVPVDGGNLRCQRMGASLPTVRAGIWARSPWRTRRPAPMALQRRLRSHHSVDLVD